MELYLHSPNKLLCSRQKQLHSSLCLNNKTLQRIVLFQLKLLPVQISSHFFRQNGSQCVHRPHHTVLSFVQFTHMQRPTSLKLKVTTLYAAYSF